MPIATRLTNTGTLLVNGIFDENTSITPANFRTASTTVYAGTLDEFTGAPVVNTNLMVWVDAAQTASYSGSGATWTDLSGNGKNYTLSNSPTFSSLTSGGVITFAGASSQYATTATTLFNSTTTNTYSINIWVYPTGAGQIVSVDGQSTPNTSYHYTALEITAAGLIYFGQWTGAMTTIITSAQSLNAWYNLAITYNGTTATAYVNGTSVGSSTIAWSAPGANTFFALMSQDSTNMSGTTAYASGSIGAFSVYNRALTAAEVAQNYNALRSRYEKTAITATQMPVVQRQQNSGTLLVNSGGFDEFTGAPVVDTNLKLWLDAGQTASYSGTGNTWTDLSTNGLNGTLVNSPTFSATPANIRFNGTSQQVTFSSNAAVQFLNTSPYTLDIWVYPTQLPPSASYQCLIDREGNPGTGRDGWNLWLYGDASSPTNMLIGAERFGLGVNYGFAGATVSSASTLTTWQHIVATYDSATLKLYRNGTQLGSVASTGNITNTTQTVGIAKGGSLAFLYASVSSAKVYNRALTADEVTTNFNALRGRYGV